MKHTLTLALLGILSGFADLEARRPILQFPGAAHVQGQVQPGVAAALLCGFGFARAIRRPRRRRGPHRIRLHAGSFGARRCLGA